MESQGLAPEIGAEGQAETPESQAENRKPWQFQKGKSGNPGGKPKNPVGSAARRLLQDMRFVYFQPQEKDRTHGHRVCREWLQADVKAFMNRMSALEEELAAVQRKACTEGSVEESPAVAPIEHVWGEEGFERAELARLLRKYGGQKP